MNYQRFSDEADLQPITPQHSKIQLSPNPPTSWGGRDERDGDRHAGLLNVKEVQEEQDVLSCVMSSRFGLQKAPETRGDIKTKLALE
jgi:hypothetical protein